MQAYGQSRKRRAHRRPFEEAATMTAEDPGNPPVRITYLAGDEFEVAVRTHRVRVDQPLADGGNDTAPTPTELFVSSLAACVAFYARRYLARHDLPADGLTVEAHYSISPRPARVGTVDLRIEVPEGVPEARKAAFLAVASHCTVHNTLVQPPVVNIELSEAHQPPLATVA